MADGPSHRGPLAVLSAVLGIVGMRDGRTSPDAGRWTREDPRLIPVSGMWRMR